MLYSVFMLLANGSKQQVGNKCLYQCEAQSLKSEMVSMGFACVIEKWSV